MRVWGLAALTALGLGAAAAAQEGPREIPPPSYEGSSYVDSAGCAFVRAVVSGVVTWVPRLSASREPVCGLAPSLVAEAPAPPEPATGPGAPIPTVAMT